MSLTFDTSDNNLEFIDTDHLINEKNNNLIDIINAWYNNVEFEQAEINPVIDIDPVDIDLDIDPMFPDQIYDDEFILPEYYQDPVLGFLPYKNQTNNQTKTQKDTDTTQTETDDDDDEIFDEPNFNIDIDSIYQKYTKEELRKFEHEKFDDEHYDCPFWNFL